MWAAIATIIAAVIGVAVSASTNKSNERSVQATNEANAAGVQATNEANLQAVRETNAANVEQANIAYQRSLPVNQVNDLMQAGMSRAGALNKLSGGGVYTPPALSTANMQSSTQQPMHFDYSGIAQAMDKLSDIPSNVQQKQIVDQQLADLKQQAEIRQKEEMRKEELHQLDLWQRHYGKNTAELLDAFSSKVVTAAAEQNYDLSQAKSYQQILRDLNLENDSDYKKMPHLARTQLFDAIKSQNDQRISQETHESNMRKSKIEETIQNLHIDQLREDYQNSVKEHKTQDKERLLREGKTALETILNENNISMQELLRECRFDKEGKPNILTKYNTALKEAWTIIGNTFGIDYLGDILKGIIKIGG